MPARMASSIVRLVGVIGLTPVGRATVRLLQMNTKERLELRGMLLDDGTW